MAQKTCFVVIGFGKKTDFESGRTLDLDKSYHNLIKPAVEAAGLTCVRADEIVHSGLIDVPMYEQLFSADVVVADLSTSNKNAFYELGIRHALKPYTTIVISEDGAKSFPFDVNHVAIRKYHHLGEDIGYSEVQRFQKLLTESIKDILNKDPRDKDSPVYTFLNNLNPPGLGEAIKTMIKQATDSITIASNESEASLVTGGTTHSLLMQQVDKAEQEGDFLTAKTLLGSIRTMMEPPKDQLGQLSQPEDPYIIQRLALLTYKSEHPTQEKSLQKALSLLQILNPQTSNDTETLGLWGAVNKRLYGLTKDVSFLTQAIRAYRRGFNLRNDYYNGINLAYLFNVRAAITTSRVEAIADFVQAQRYRREVLEACEQWLQDNPTPTNQNPKASIGHKKNLYWVLATKAEAYIGIGDTETGEQLLKQAYAIAPLNWMRTSTEDQIKKLQPLLSNSPLRYVQAD
ncbi:TRAFs-binding domain-containing protein [Fibrella aquatilis]|uniref:DUF4071 domain-containing protein n=1 Tax=Fibrella aquatilis TaxID=2817059 RepID=A0A939G608_9BACT|nr:TRAFs-binding domain-containing protein [Fibrella aquatilis]MBO0932536.1 DUF4071 domain-containing protein [Fibrella aquatilis]